MNVHRLARTAQRCLHQSSVRMAVTNMQMPAMSPTMTEGGIASWKKQEGESFTAGDVLLEIETDKATIDVEAQDDGVMGKILIGDGAKNVPVGKVIALLAEEGDDISNLQPPKEEAAPSKKDSTPPSASPPKQEESEASSSSSSSSPPPVHATSIHHDGPMFPSVHRLLIENGISDPSKIKGTGVRGMLTKGDVLTHLGKASGPLGTFKVLQAKETKPAEVKKESIKPLDGAEIRRLIVSGMLNNSLRARAPRASPTPVDFDSVISDYLPPSASKSTPAAVKPPSKPSKVSDYFEGLL